MNDIDTLFHRLRSQKRKAFIPFVTAGDPDLPTTTALVRELARRGASLVEIGFPCSGPVADGSVTEACSTRPPLQGLRSESKFATVRRLNVAVPLVAMVSYSLVHHRGPAKFIDEAQAVGFSGAIVPDLPVEESAELAKLAAARDFKLIQLVTPATPRDRAIDIAKRSTGFLYCVSVVGITGERAELPATLLDQLRWLRTQTDLPMCVGFGISKPEHVTALRDHADGVIVGSAVVRQLVQAGTQAVGELAESLMKALN